MLDILGIIPARGGSKGILQKNTAMVGGKPLLAYTCEAALCSRRLRRVVMSTDDPTIAEVGRKYGVEVPFMRPVDLASDDTPMISVMHNALSNLWRAEKYEPDVVVLLQPTSPLRRAEHIDAALDLLLSTGADSVVSVVEVPHHYNPVSLLRIEEGKLVPVAEGPPILRRQEKPQVYARNGPAILAVKRNVLMEKNSLFGHDCRPLIMAPEDSIDVDGPLDLLLVELLLARRGVASG